MAEIFQALWSDEQFCSRVARRCKELGRSQRSVLKEAGCAHDYLQTNPAHGRRIDRIFRIAEVLDMPVARLLGLPRENVPIDAEILLLAYRAAREATGPDPQDDTVFVRVMAAVYKVAANADARGGNDC